MASDHVLDLSYDEDGDVLYASLGSPQAALSYEVTKDIWLDYVSPNRTVVGVTIINFVRHYPVEDMEQLLPMGREVVQDILQQYPSVPIVERGQEPEMANDVSPYVQVFTSGTYGFGSDRRTMYVGGVSHIHSPLEPAISGSRS